MQVGRVRHEKWPSSLLAAILLVYNKVNKVCPVHIKPPKKGEVKSILKKHDLSEDGSLNKEEFTTVIGDIVAGTRLEIRPHIITQKHVQGAPIRGTRPSGFEWCQAWRSSWRCFRLLGTASKRAWMLWGLKPSTGFLRLCSPLGVRLCSSWAPWLSHAVMTSQYLWEMSAR